MNNIFILSDDKMFTLEFDTCEKIFKEINKRVKENNINPFNLKKCYKIERKIYKIKDKKYIHLHGQYFKVKKDKNNDYYITEFENNKYCGRLKNELQ